MPKKKDLTGERFGRLVVIGDSGKRTKQRQVIWKCICDCGNATNVRSNLLATGETKSCGCLAKEIGRKNSKININKALESVKYKKYLENDSKENTKLTAINPKRKINKNNTSGTTGVYWIKNIRKWQASIFLKGENITFGYFKNKQDAINVRKEAEEKYFKPILDKYKKTDSAANETSQ